MRAIAVDKLKGEPRLIDVSQPVPKPEQLLVKIDATAINPFDWKVSDGIMEGVMPAVFPLILGQDAAGTVTAVGNRVTRFKPGDKVFGQFFHPPVGEGTFAEYAVVPETAPLALLPPEINAAIAAALPTAGMTALAMIEALDLKPKARVLIVGATGGVGSFATQLAAAKGFQVLATASADEADRMRTLGASEVFEPRKGNLAEEIKRSHPDGIDGLIDLVSDGPALAALSEIVRNGGCVLTTVFTADEKALRGRGIRGGNFQLKSNSALLERLAETVKSGKLTVPIDSTISLEAAPAAIARSRAGHARGKTVILPAARP
jgi:NADPH:quinone reductase-like Zn-dependent oxidoreductase